jgi:hypothetical protein
MVFETPLVRRYTYELRNMLRYYIFLYARGLLSYIRIDRAAQVYACMSHQNGICHVKVSHRLLYLL